MYRSLSPLERADRMKSSFSVAIMSERIRRENTAMVPSASAIAGRIDVCRLAPMPSLSRFQFDAGRRFHRTANSQIRKIPTMKFGIDSATCATAEVVLSCHFDCL